MSRYELLRNLREEGINDFDVIRADERRWPERYPVFLRHEHDHGRPLSSDLLHNKEALAAGLERARMDGVSLRGIGSTNNVWLCAHFHSQGGESVRKVAFLPFGRIEEAASLYGRRRDRNSYGRASVNLLHTI
jgi:hypothetical protein